MPSKIYEFNLLDKYNTPEGDIMRTVEQNLVTEAGLQGWASGYTYQQVSKPTQKSTGEIEYAFVVYGEFVSSTGEDYSNHESSNQTQQNSSAAKPAEL
jgi:hypothetical protein